MGSDLKEWRDEWQLAASNGNLATGSVDQYLLGVDQFIQWMDHTHPHANVEDLHERHVNAWLGHLAHRDTRPLRPATRKLRLIAVRVWANYLVKQSDCLLTVNPTVGITFPEPDDDPVPVIPDDDLRALLATCDGPDFINLRDKLIIRLLLDTGGRRGEIAAINVDEVNQKTHELLLDGKTGKRIVPYSSKTAIALTKYLRARTRRPGFGDQALILSTRPTNRGWRLTGIGLFQVVQRRAAQAGLSYPVWPHMFRHTWSHDMKTAGVSDEDLETLAGWKPGSRMSRRYGRSMAQQRARETARRLGRGDRV